MIQKILIAEQLQTTKNDIENDTENESDHVLNTVNVIWEGDVSPPRDFTPTPVPVSRWCSDEGVEDGSTLEPLTGDDERAQ